MTCPAKRGERPTTRPTPRQGALYAAGKLQALHCGRASHREEACAHARRRARVHWGRAKSIAGRGERDHGVQPAALDRIASSEVAVVDLGAVLAELLGQVVVA
eukprot:7619407-Alexandrium_andersonii.AAC.1